MDIQELDRVAVQESVRLLDLAGPDDWERPTPCAGWNLRQLAEHMAAQHHGFADAAAGVRTELADWQPVPLGDDPVSGYRASAQRVTDAFSAPGALNREMWLPEIRTTAGFPAAIGIGFHFLDYVVHSWDVAKSLGLEPDFDTEVADTALMVALRVPDGEPRLVPGSAFAPSLPPAPGAGALDLALLALGRSPDWPAAGAAAGAGRPGPGAAEEAGPVLSELRKNVARRLELTEDEVFDGRPLSAVLVASPTAINSIDLLDAFAGALADVGLEDVELPAMTLDNSAAEVIGALAAQLVPDAVS
jgi:uncharacterized protein (TIGR03086 family)